MKLLELFGSINSFSEIAIEYGLKALILNINEINLNDDLIISRLINYKPDIVSIAPPCKCFSVAAIGKNWTKNGDKLYIPKTNKTLEAIINVDRIIFLIRKINPKFWFIENPIGVLRKIINPIFEEYGINDYIRRSVTYCQYGDIRMKPTDIWTNCFIWKPKSMCKNGDPCHISAPRGSRRGTQGLKDNTKSLIPEKLCREIIDICIRDYKGKR